MSITKTGIENGFLQDGILYYRSESLLAKTMTEDEYNKKMQGGA